MFTLKESKAKEVVESLLNEYFESYKDSISTDAPVLDTFRPAEHAWFSPIWRTTTSTDDGATVEFCVAGREARTTQDGFISQSRPDLLMHGLDDETTSPSQPDAYSHIQQIQDISPTFLYGTSGAGKTRTVFEYLSRNKGFYLVAAPEAGRTPGSLDLLSLLKMDGRMGYVELKSKDEDRVVDKKNRAMMRKQLALLLYIRYAVHEKLEKHLTKKKMTAYEWLLYQVFPHRFLGDDIFQLVFKACWRFRSFEDFQLEDVMPFTSEVSKPETTWSVFVDEAQSLLKEGTVNFCDSNCTVFRSSFSAVMGELWRMQIGVHDLRHAVFSGTGLSFDELWEHAASLVSKNSDEATTKEKVFFSKFKTLDVEGVRRYIGGFLDLGKIDPAVSEHVAKWLVGRPRWAANFLTVYASRKTKESIHAGTQFRGSDGTLTMDGRMMETIGRFLSVMTVRPSANRTSWSAGDTSALAIFETARSKIAKENLEILMDVMNDVKDAVFKFHLGGTPHIFKNEKAKFLIETGFSTVSVESSTGTAIEGTFNEPIIIEAGVNFFGGVDNAVLRTLINQYRGGRGDAFELLVTKGLRMNENSYHKFLESTLTGKVDLEKIAEWKNYVPHIKSAYGVLCLITGSDIDATLEWLMNSKDAKFEGQIPPFCLPDTSIGPDVIFFIRTQSTYSVFRLCCIQSKLLSSDKISNQQAALRTLVSDLLYHERRSNTDLAKLSRQLSPEQKAIWEKIRSQLISDDRPCLRILVQTAEATSSAVSGPVASDATSPNSSSNKRKNEILIVLDKSNLGEILTEEDLSVVNLVLHSNKKARAT